MGKFSARVGEWVLKSQRGLHAVAQDATQKTVEEAQLPQAKGGRMPVDTAFLRNSAAANIGSMPSGNGRRENGAPSGGDNQIAATIISWKPGQTLYVGWVAVYARDMDFRYGFVRMAAQNWQIHVRDAVKRYRRGGGR